MTCGVMGEVAADMYGMDDLPAIRAGACGRVAVDHGVLAVGGRATSIIPYTLPSLRSVILPSLFTSLRVSLYAVYEFRFIRTSTADLWRNGMRAMSLPSDMLLPLRPPLV